jgi:hypothetical protein
MCVFRGGSVTAYEICNIKPCKGSGETVLRLVTIGSGLVFLAQKRHNQWIPF